MQRDQYTEEQQKDIEERVAKAVSALKELQLQPGVVMQAVNIQNDVFSMQPLAYLQDTKYTPTVSPIQDV